MKTEGKANKAVRICGYLTLLLLCALPVLRLVIFLSSSGSNNPSNDDADFLPLLDAVLNGTYPWGNFLKDTFYFSTAWPASAGHSDAFPALLQVALAFLSRENLYVYTIYLGIGFAICKIILIFDAYTHSQKGDPSRWLLLPILFALGFFTTQVSSFEFGLAAIEQGFNQLGLVLGVWGLVRFRYRWSAMWLMGLGGWLASWSWGNGPLVWPAFLLGMLMLGYRRFAHYIYWFVFCLASVAPHFWFLVFREGSQQPSPISSLFLSIFNFSFFLRGIGWPLAQGLSANEPLWRGLGGFAFLSVGIVLFLLNRKKIKCETLAAPAMLLGYGLLSILVIGSYRKDLAPWYAAPFMVVWFGLVGVANIFWRQPTSFEAHGRKGPSKKIIAPRIWSIAFLLVLGFYCIMPYRSFESSSFYMRERSPVASSCLRNYKIAPTYCEQTLFLWGAGHSGIVSNLADPLERHHLSVFAPSQRWTLQGDFILNTVRLNEAPGIPKALWSPDLKNVNVPFFDYRQLNLLLHTGNSIDWTMTLPKNLGSAEFHSAIAISQSAPKDAISDGILFEVMVGVEGRPAQTLFSQFVSSDQRSWKPFSISLSQFAGQTINIRLTSAMVGNNIHDWGMYRFPYVDLKLSDPQESSGNIPNLKAEVRPSNTDLSDQVTKTTPEDRVLDISNLELWDWRGLQSGTDPKQEKSMLVGSDPRIESKKPLDICISDYTHLSFSMAATSNISPRATQLFFQIHGKSDYQRVIWIPLLADDRPHQYTYDLRLLDLDVNDRLAGLRLDPVEKGTVPNESRVQISDLRLIGKNAPNKCR